MPRNRKNGFRLLDLFAGQGGAGHGYWLAGFEVVGVDNRPMKRNPHEFHCDDALKFLAAHHGEFDAFHASPPCQAHTVAKKIHGTEGRGYECYIERCREMFTLIGKPWVIENVPLSPLIDPIELSGKTFGLGVVRRRLFESSFYIKEPPRETYPPNCTRSHRGLSTGGEYITVAGHNFLVDEGRAAMGIEWMTRDGLAQAIPPAYTRYIARYLKRALKEPQQ
jgi:DNA (cytosine-5)-methyltransferase 1